MYRDGSLVVLKGKKSAREIKDWLEEFQQTVNKVVANQHLQFTSEICTTEENSRTPAKEEWVQIVTKDEFPFLDMIMSGLVILRVWGKGRQLKYVGKESTYTPGTLRAIPSGVLDRLAKLTSR